MKSTLVFPGQGSQYVGMGKDLYDTFGYVREIFQEASHVLGKDLAELCFHGPEDDLRLTENTQPTIFTVSVACYEVLRRELGVNASAGAGHSLGEYTALVCAGALKFHESLSVLEKRGRFMQEAVPAGKGAMAAIIGLSAEEVDHILGGIEGVVELANLNGAGQVVISGESGPVREGIARAKDAGAKRALELPVSAPFHCSLMIPAAERLKPHLQEMALGTFSHPVTANLTGDSYPGTSEVPRYLEKQIYSPVQWEGTINRFASGEPGILIEAGPGKVLSGLARRMLHEWRITSFGSLEELGKVKETLK